METEIWSFTVVGLELHAWQWAIFFFFLLVLISASPTNTYFLSLRTRGAKIQYIPSTQYTEWTKLAVLHYAPLDSSYKTE